ncbi:MAG: hypothetical protein AAGU27_22000 [Dehalobacterium sp.]
MSFILSYFNNVDNKDKASKADLESIETLRKQLVEVGFAADEVNFMVRTHAKKKSLSELSSSEIKEIKEALVEQLEIARKCLNLIKEA